MLIKIITLFNACSTFYLIKEFSQNILVVLSDVDNIILTIGNNE